MKKGKGAATTNPDLQPSNLPCSLPIHMQVRLDWEPQAVNQLFPALAKHDLYNYLETQLLESAFPRFLEVFELLC